MLLTETSVSSTEPVTVTEAKSHLRVDISTDDTYIGTLITAARQYVEEYCQRSFVAKTYRLDLSQFYDSVTLAKGPVQSITSVKYYNTASPSVLTTLASTVYQLHGDTISRAYGESWESTNVRPDAVQITYTTGYSDLYSPLGTGASVPVGVKQAILLLVGALYENRESEVLYPGQLIQIKAFHSLLQPYRLFQ